MKLLYLNLFVDDCLGDLQELKQSCADLVGRDWKDGDKARAAEVLDAFISLFDVLYAFASFGGEPFLMDAGPILASSHVWAWVTKWLIVGLNIKYVVLR